MYILGIDIGGTFTDVIALDAQTGTIRSGKASTTPQNFSKGVINGVKELGIDLEDVFRIIHGTTICTNSLIERTEAKTGFIGTKGFSDEFDIQRMVRRWGKSFYSSIYDLQQNKPAPFIPRYLRTEVDERVIYPGEVLKTLDYQEACAVAKQLVGQGVDAVAICFLWSFVNPENEKKMMAVIREMAPKVAVCVSSDVVPTFREYERMVTTAINASLMPIISDYIANIESELAGHGFGGTLFLMQSHGGVTYPSVVIDKPIYTLRSGPVGGVVAANYLGKRIGRKNILSCDMGGTSCDISLIRDNQMQVTDEEEVEYYPIKVPTADISCIGAGGGSIAGIDAAGALTVGPESAGAQPGPACYGRGGTQPTVTDANLVLGRIDPESFCGGRFNLDREAAVKSLSAIADSFKWSIYEAADAIIRISVASMADLVRLRTVDRGLDPREFSMFAFGGAGPLHASLIAQETAIGEVVVPVQPGAFSALGMVVSELSYYDQVSFLHPMERVEPEMLNKAFLNLERNGADLLRKGQIKDDEMMFVRSAAMRYVLQEWEVNVPIPGGILDQNTLAKIGDDFHKIHHARFGYSRKDREIEFVTIFLHSIALVPPLDYEKQPAGSADPSKAVRERREVYIDKTSGMASVKVYERAELVPGNIIKGPAIIEEPTSTTYMQPEWIGTVEEMGNIIIKPAG